MAIACIVEGHGEVESVPILVRRIGVEQEQPVFPKVERPIRIPGSKLRKEDEFVRAVHLAAARAGPGGAVLVLIDAEDDCPAELGPALLHLARAARPDVPIRVVLAKFEFEAWFLAAAESLRGVRDLPDDLVPPADPEAIRGAKEWLSRQMPAGRSYRETLDQPALASQFDSAAAAQGARSFEKCYRDIVELIDVDP